MPTTELARLTFLTQEFSGDFRPLYDQILVRELAPEERIGSIWVPENVQHGPDGDKYLSRGVVVACGPGDKCVTCGGTGEHPEEADSCPQCAGLKRFNMNVSPGDTIIFDRPSNRKIVLNDEPYYILHEQQHVIAVIG